MSLLSVTPKGTVSVTEEEVVDIAAQWGYTIKEDEISQYTTLLSATCNALQFVDEMEDYQPTPDLTKTPRENIYFPKPENNLDNAWAWRFDLKSTSPTSILLKNKTLCIKDNVAIAGIPCLLGTDTFTDWIPQTDATVITRILAASGTILGKAVCENMSVSAASYTAATGPISNPYARGYSAGGSSSGTANLVAKGEVDMGIGCDQGGSIRIPAALCGLVGLKATSGLVPYTGIVSNEATIDYVGPITTNVMDCAVLLEAIAGVDGLDDRQRAGIPFLKDVPKYSKILEEGKEKGVKGLRIGVLKEGLSNALVDEGLKSKFWEAVKVFEGLGAMVEEVSVPIHTIAPAIFSVASRQGGALGRDGKATGRRQVMLTDLYEKMLPHTAESIEKMSCVSKTSLFSTTYGWKHYPNLYAKSVNLCRKMTEEYDKALESYDVLIMPTCIIPATPLPSPDASVITKMSSTIGKLENTCPFNATGHPALALPIGFVDGRDEGVRVPASMQIVGGMCEENMVMRVGYAWECAEDWKKF